MWFWKSKPDAFDLPIDDAFALEESGRVVVAGVIAEGAIAKGVKAVLQTNGSAIPVTVLGLEAGLDNPVKSARAGARVAVMIEGADKADVSEDARLVAKGG